MLPLLRRDSVSVGPNCSDIFAGALMAAILARGSDSVQRYLQSTPFRCYLRYGGHEDDEGLEADEGDESRSGDEIGHEGEEGVGYRQGQEGQGRCVPREQGEDHWGPAADRLDEERDREGRQQEGPCQGQEGLRPHQGLDPCSAESSSGTRGARLPGGEEGLVALHEGPGVLRPVSTVVLAA